MNSKITLLASCLLLAIQAAYGQTPNTWKQKANFGGTGRIGAVGFSIGNYGYVGTGQDSLGIGEFKDFWQYDPVTDIWTQKADFGGGYREYASGYSLLGKGYIGLGQQNVEMNDWWCYDPAANSWTQKTSAPRYSTDGVSFSIGSYGYFLYIDIYTHSSITQLWQYNPVSDSWVQKANFPGARRSYYFGLSGADYGYVGTGIADTSGAVSFVTLKDFWQYSPATDSWTQKANFGGGARTRANSFVIKGKAYVGGGFDSSGYNILTDYWQYDPVGDKWAQVANFSGISVAGAACFSIDNIGYLCSGWDGNGNNGYQKAFWQYTPPADTPNTWVRRTDFGGLRRINAVSFSIGNKGYTGTGQTVSSLGISSLASDFWAYDTLTDSWTQMADFGGSPRTAAAGFAIGNYGYIGTGYSTSNTKDFWQYDPASNTWTQKADFAGAARAQGIGLNIGNKGYIGLGVGVLNYLDIWEYDPTTDVWTQKSDFAGGTSQLQPGVFSINNKGYFCSGGIGVALSQKVWQYDPANDSWQQKSNFPGAGRTYSFGASTAQKGYFGFGNNSYQDFWEYDPALDAWTQKTDYPLALPNRYGFVLGNNIFVGDMWTNSFYEYIPSAPIPTTATWTGTTNTDWNTATNWNPSIVPGNNTNVLIPATTNQPKVAAHDTFAVHGITLNSGATLTIDTSSVLQVGDSATLNGTVIGLGMLSLTGSAPQMVIANDTISNLELNNSHGATLLAGSALNIKYNYLPTSGTLINIGTFRLLSDTTGTATIAPGSSAGGYISGTVNVQQYIHSGRRAYRFLAHPFSTETPISQLAPAFDITGNGGSSNGFTTTGTNSPSAFWYNTVTANGSDTDDVTGWIPYTSMTDTASNAWNQYEGLRIIIRGLPGEGLLGQTYIPSATTINMHGALNQGDQTITLATNGNKGYNFIGNPYAAPIDLSTLTLGSSVGANFWVWDPNQGLEGAYVSQPLSVPYMLPAYSSFVVTNTAATNNTITFHESSKGLHDNTNLFKTTGGAMGSNMLQLHVRSNSGQVSWDRLLVYFNDAASANTDRLDGDKLQNGGLNFYSFTADNKQESIDVRPYVDGQVIKLGLTATVQQNYTIDVDNLNVPAGVRILLHDKYMGNTIPLHQGDTYAFGIGTDPNSQGDNRFELNLSGKPNGISNINATSKLNVTVSPNPATDIAVVHFNTTEMGNTTVYVTDVVGQQIYSQELGMQQQGSIAIPVGKMAAGIYIITVHCGEETVTKRFVKQ